MKYEIQLNGIQKKLPAGYQLPASFHTFVERCREAQRGDLGWFAVKTQPTRDLLGFDPKHEMVAFLRLPDGGFIALWFCSKRSPAVVSCDSEGTMEIVGATWVDFLTRLSKRKTGNPDLDDRELSKMPSIRGVGSRLTPLAAKRREFKRWIEQQAPEGAKADDTTSEKIRAELVDLMTRHFDEQRQEHEEEEEEDATYIVDLYVTLTLRSYKVDWAAGGIKAYPDPKRLQPVLERLADYLGRSLKKSEVSVWSDGCVFIDGNIRLGDSSL